MSIRHISIIGGGIAGLATAIGLARRGFRITVFEKAKDFEPVGAGLQLGPNAVRALISLGAWDAVEPVTRKIDEIAIRSGQTGKTLKRLGTGERFKQQFGQFYRVALRADLHEALITVAQTLPQITLVMNAHDVLPEGITIAADGVWSETRGRLFPSTQAVIHRDRIFRAGLRSASSDDAKVTLWLFPQGHVVHYAVGNPLVQNLVAVTSGQMPEDHFGSACEELKHLLQVQKYGEWRAAFVPALEAWHKGNTLLIGDAAHGTLPYLAQGAAMALEDAAALAKLFDAQADPQINFAAFEKIRKPRTTKLHRETLKAGKIYHQSPPLSALRDLALTAMPDQFLLARQSWIYKN